MLTSSANQNTLTLVGVNTTQALGALSEAWSNVGGPFNGYENNNDGINEAGSTFNTTMQALSSALALSMQYAATLPSTDLQGNQTGYAQSLLMALSNIPVSSSGNITADYNSMSSAASSVASFVQQIQAEMVQADSNGSQNLFIQSGGVQGTPATFTAGIQQWYDGLTNPTLNQTSIYNTTMQLINGPYGGGMGLGPADTSYQQKPNSLQQALSQLTSTQNQLTTDFEGVDWGKQNTQTFASQVSSFVNSLNNDVTAAQASTTEQEGQAQTFSNEFSTLLSDLEKALASIPANFR